MWRDYESRRVGGRHWQLLMAVDNSWLRFGEHGRQNPLKKVGELAQFRFRSGVTRGMATDDSALPIRLTVRSADAVGELYREHALGLTRLAMMLIGDPESAQDVVQDAFLGLYRAWPRLRDSSKAVVYLRSAVLNNSRGVLRARYRSRLLAQRHDPPVWSAEAAVMAREDERAVLAAVARLPARQREVLALRYYLGLSYAEIAEALSIAAGTVSSTVSHAMTALARDLGEV
jgi:RNA polymerase sigma-70 factor (sigma-E family)